MNTGAILSDGRTRTSTSPRCDRWALRPFGREGGYAMFHVSEAVELLLVFLMILIAQAAPISSGNGWTGRNNAATR